MSTVLTGYWNSGTIQGQASNIETHEIQLFFLGKQETSIFLRDRTSKLITRIW